MQEKSHLEVLTPLLTRMEQGGVFMSTHFAGQDNTMVMGWGGLTYFWRKPVVIAPVRHARWTHQAVSGSGAFTLSIPADGMEEALRFCGTESGRDFRKFEGHGLTALPAQKVQAPIVGGCPLHLECVVRMVQEMPEDTDPGILSACYSDGDLHTLFFGEVVACYAL